MAFGKLLRSFVKVQFPGQLSALAARVQVQPAESVFCGDFLAIASRAKQLRFGEFQNEEDVWKASMNY
jgi:hypothetical protein